MEERAEVHHNMTAEQLIAARNKKKADLKQEEIEQLKQQLSIRERLERKLKTEVVEVKMKDDLGDFVLRFRKLTPSEHDAIADVQKQLSTADDAKKKELMHTLYSYLGSVSMDGLDSDFWKGGTGYSPDILVTVLLKVMAASTFPDEEQLKEISSFRLK